MRATSGRRRRMAALDQVGVTHRRSGVRHLRARSLDRAVRPTRTMRPPYGVTVGQRRADARVSWRRTAGGHEGQPRHVGSEPVESRRTSPSIGRPCGWPLRRAQLRDRRSAGTGERTVTCAGTRRCARRASRRGCGSAPPRRPGPRRAPSSSQAGDPRLTAWPSSPRSVVRAGARRARRRRTPPRGGGHDARGVARALGARRGARDDLPALARRRAHPPGRRARHSRARRE